MAPTDLLHAIKYGSSGPIYTACGAKVCKYTITPGLIGYEDHLAE